MPCVGHGASAQHRREEKLRRMADSVREILKGLGEDVQREGLLDTPKRVAKALIDVTSGYQQDPASVIGSALFTEPSSRGGVVLVRDIDFASTSEATLLPFHGRCHVAYVPSEGVVLGLSKLARLTKLYSKRLQSQRRLAAEIATALARSLPCSGVAVVLQARHLSSPGPSPPQEATTAALSGCFAEPGSEQLLELQELLGLPDLAAAADTTSLPCALPTSDSSLSMALALSDDGEGSSVGCCGCSVVAPRTPDASEKDTDGDSDDVAMAPEVDPPLLSSPLPLEGMEAAVQQLLLEVGEDVARSELQGTARRYIMSLLASTLGYHLKMPGLGNEQQQQQQQQQQSEQSEQQSEQRSEQRHVQQQQQQQQQSQSEQQSEQRSEQRHVQQQQQQQQQQQGASFPQCLMEDMQDAGSVGSGSSRGGCCSSCSSLASVATSTTSAACSHLGRAVTLHHATFHFRSLCEHHMLPFYGKVHVAYHHPDGAAGAAGGHDVAAGTAGGAAQAPPLAAGPLRVSDLESIVAAYTQRLQVQERITHQVADAVAQLLASRRPGAAAAGAETEASCGVMVVVDATHLCMVARGVESHGGSTTSTAVRGATLLAAPELRRAVLSEARRTAMRS